MKAILSIVFVLFILSYHVACRGGKDVSIGLAQQDSLNVFVTFDIRSDSILEYVPTWVDSFLKDQHTCDFKLRMIKPQALLESDQISAADLSNARLNQLKRRIEESTCSVGNSLHIIVEHNVTYRVDVKSVQYWLSPIKLN